MRRRLAVCLALLAVAAPFAVTPTSAAPAAKARPRVREVTARAGDTEWTTSTFTVDGPAMPPAQPLDVFFLVDTSPWATPETFAMTRDGLVDAARRLASRPGVRVGFGEYRDLGDADAEGQVTYRLRRRLAPPDASLYDGLAALRTGPVDRPGTAATIALEEAVRGDGHLAVVPPGQDAGFAKEATRRDGVVVLVTDSRTALVLNDPGTPGWYYGHTVYTDPYYASQYAAEVADVVALVPWTATPPAGTIEDAEKLTVFHPRAFGPHPCVGPRERPFEELDVDDALVCAPRLDAADARASRQRLAALVPALIDARGAWTGGTLRLPKDLQQRREPFETFAYATAMPYSTDARRAFRTTVVVGLRCPKESAGKSYTIPVGVARHAQTVTSEQKDLATVRLHCR